MTDLPGMTVFENAMGIHAVRLHYAADDEKRVDHLDPRVAEGAQKWLDVQRLQYPDPNDFQREMEINWHVGKGSRVFPQFTEMYHVRPLTAHKRKVIYRGWDFGYHAPACLLAQIDLEGRLALLKEVVGAKQITSAFADRVIERGAEWFGAHVPGFEDFCDPAGQQVRAIESEKSERRDIDVLAGKGIHPKYEWGWSRKDGRTLIHQLLGFRTDGTPSLLLDLGGCPILGQAFLGRYVYPETLTGKTREDPNDDEHPYGDVMAALRYLVTGLHRRLALTRFKASPLAQAQARPDYVGYGTRRW